jgi:hypothetical protein
VIEARPAATKLIDPLCHTALLCWPLHAGEMLTENLRHCLLAPDKLRSELRSQGHTSLSNIFAVVLEPTGIFSVITDGELGLTAESCGEQRLSGAAMQGHAAVFNQLHAAANSTDPHSIHIPYAGASVGQRSDCFCCCHTLLQMRPRRTSACCRMWRDMSST